MKLTAKRGALVGMLAGVLAILVLLAVAFAGADPPDGLGERLEGFGLQLTLLGAPLSLLAMRLEGTLDPKSNLYVLVSYVELAAMPLQLALVGALIGWVADRWRRRG
jgi:hypothetical protein